jgi:hypothetical protein
MSWAGLLYGTPSRRLTQADEERWNLEDPHAVYAADELGTPFLPQIDPNMSGLSAPMIPWSMTCGF